jgi:mono/diheme cytochrome c family protein
MNRIIFAFILLVALMASTFMSLSSAVANPVASKDSETDATHQIGQKIFSTKCASCHGSDGQGVEKFYPDPLVGDASIGELTAIIAETMPEEDPDACVGTEAEAVASFMHHQFYSEAAQIRNRPPRQALQRLTGNQLRSSLSNLYGHFANIRTDKWSERQSQHGLEAHYFTGMQWKDDARKIQRTDPVIDFDFKLDGPKHADGKDAGIDGENFYIHWNGGLRVEQTGRYEIIVRSTTSFICKFGHDRNEMIDNHVQSEGRDEFRRTLTLTGGRTYPIRIDFKQRKRKGETPPSSVSISWIPPGGVEEIVPAKHWVPGWVPAALRLETQMPPDDRTYGFPRGISVDPAWDEAVTSAALEFATQVNDELWEDYQNRHKKDKLSREDLLRQFLNELIAVAHRVPSDSPATERIVNTAFAANQDDTDRIRHAVLLTIKSPRYLYPSLDTDRSEAWQAASRVALTLQDCLPADEWLIKELNKQPATDPNRIRNLANVLVDDARTRAKVREMFYHWLEISPADDLRKDEELFPGFDAALVSDLRESLDTFIDTVVWSEASDYRQLVAADWALTTPRLSQFYGDAWAPAESGETPGQADSASQLTRTVADANAHVGVLTHPLVMAKFAHHRNSSPIHRGVFLIRHVMGRTLRPPNAAFAPLSPDLHPDLTTRQRVELQTSPESCQICHAKINPLGYALEQFDAVGRFRQQENGKPIDASGHYTTRGDEEVRFQTARELGDYIASSEDAQSAFVSRVFQYMVKQPIAAYGADRHEILTKQFRDSGFNIRELLIEIAVTSYHH